MKVKKPKDMVPISKSCQGWAATDLRDIEERILSLRTTWGNPEFFPLPSPPLLAIFTPYRKPWKKRKQKETLPHNLLE